MRNTKHTVMDLKGCERSDRSGLPLFDGHPSRSEHIVLYCNLNIVLT